MTKLFRPIYMEDDERAGHWQNFADKVVCSDDGMRAQSYDTGLLEEMPYYKYGPEDSSVPGIYYYYSAGCFWDWLDQDLGHETFLEVIAEMDSKRGTSLNRIYDILVDVIGSDSANVAVDRWGIPKS